MTRREQILAMRNEGKTWQQIGDHFGISRQRVHVLAKENPMDYYRSFPAYKALDRHRQHRDKPVKHKRKPCEYCDKQSSLKDVL